MKQFRDLPIGTEFEFDHSGYGDHARTEHGPWVKWAERLYRRGDGQVRVVSGVRLGVRTDGTCGAERPEA